MDRDHWIGEVERAKPEFARWISPADDETAVSTSVSEALSSAVSALSYGSRGCRVEFVQMRNGEILLEDYRRQISGRTSVASVTHVYYQNCFMNR